ncbi:hypothetical protein [Brevibacterium album]|nr:hypothetical protein [Brevibacterium album]
MQAEGADPLDVRIVGSRLGRTYLSFEDEKTVPKSIDARVEPELTCE